MFWGRWYAQEDKILGVLCKNILTFNCFKTNKKNNKNYIKSAPVFFTIEHLVQLFLCGLDICLTISITA